MGKSTTPKYVVDIYTRQPNGATRKDTMAWSGHTSKLEDWVLQYGKSLECGGVNAHISAAAGFIPYPNKAIIRHNYTNGATVKEWKASMFFAW